MESTDYKVIVDTQAQYSVWPEEIEPPLGWSETEAQGSLVACLDYIDDVWKEREVDPQAEQFIVIANDEDMLSISLADEECPSGWREVTDANTLSASLARIRDAWREDSPLPLPLRGEDSDED